MISNSCLYSISFMLSPQQLHFFQKQLSIDPLPFPADIRQSAKLIKWLSSCTSPGTFGVSLPFFQYHLTKDSFIGIVGLTELDPLTVGLDNPLILQ